MKFVANYENSDIEVTPRGYSQVLGLNEPYLKSPQDRKLDYWLKSKYIFWLMPPRGPYGQDKIYFSSTSWVDGVFI